MALFEHDQDRSTPTTPAEDSRPTRGAQSGKAGNDAGAPAAGIQAPAGWGAASAATWSASRIVDRPIVALTPLSRRSAVNPCQTRHLKGVLP